MSSKPALKCQIIPIDFGHLLVPENIFVEVIQHDVGEGNEEIIWRGRQVPLFECTDKESARDDAESLGRIAILRTVMGEMSLPFIAIKVSGISHSVYVSDELVKEDDDEEILFLSACSVRVGSLLCTIPDLPKMEKLMLEKRFAVSA